MYVIFLVRFIPGQNDNFTEHTGQRFYKHTRIGANPDHYLKSIKQNEKAKYKMNPTEKLQITPVA